MPDIERCKNCGAELTEVPEPLNHEWYILCLECRAQNLIAVRLMADRRATVKITGWRQ
jgi:DNA-directed RNA polymerase subunit RPC12/RpoP